jgi:hypothetical protein
MIAGEVYFSWELLSMLLQSLAIKRMENGLMAGVPQIGHFPYALSLGTKVDRYRY